MTIWRVTVTLDDTIPAQAAILTNIETNTAALTNPQNPQALLQIQRVS